MTAWLSKTPAQQVIEKIIESEPIVEFTEQEKKVINELYSKVITEEWKKEVKNYIDSKFSWNTKNKLSNLLSNVESNINDYWMDALSKKSNSKFFNIILSNNMALEWYKELIIWKKIENNKDLFPNWHETLNLVYWKKITDEIWLKSAGTFAMDKVWWLFEWILWKMTNLGNSNLKEWIDLTEMWNLVDELWSIWDKKEENFTEKQLWIFWKLIWYIDSITKWYTDNLNKLIILWKKDKDWLKKILDNPTVLNEVLETWKTNKDWYNIDLDNKKLSFAWNIDLDKSKNDFMKTLIESTNKSWKTLDNLKENVKGLSNILKKMWLDSNELRWFRDWLKDIPLIWEFLFSLIWFFLSDWMLKLMDGNPWEKDYETSGKNLQTFIKWDNDKKTPFLLDDKMFENEDNTKLIEWFLKVVDTSDENNFKNIEINKKNQDTDKYKESKRTLLINDSKFWETIFSDKESSDPILEQIRKESQKIKKDNKNISSKDYFEKISKIKIELTQVIKPLTENELKLQEIKLKENKIIIETDKSDLSVKIENIDKLPSNIVLDNKKELNIDFKDNKILLDNKEFSLKDGDILGIRFEQENIILKVKEGSWSEVEKKLTKKNFAIILAWLAVWETITNNILNFVTSKEKEAFIVKEGQIKENEKIASERTSLEAEKSTLESEISLLKTSIKNIDLEIKDFDTKLLSFESNILNKKWNLATLLKTKDDNDLKITKENDNIIILNDKLEDISAWKIWEWWEDRLEKVKLERSIRDLKRANDKIDKQVLALNKEIDIINKQIDDLYLQKTVKDNELNTKNKELITKNDRFVEIWTKLWINTKKAEVLNIQIKQQEVVVEKNRSIEEARKKLEDENKNRLENIVNIEKNKKSFSELLENPKKIDELKLTLDDWVEIIFDKVDKKLIFLWETFGIKETLSYRWVKNTIDKKFEQFSFIEIFKDKKNKIDFIKTLDDLKNKKTAKYSIIEFEKKS